MNTNYKAGHDAEKIAAEYLRRNGYKVLDINWRTKYCEVDIVASRDSCIYFVEVKSRTTSHQGSGLDYITPKKLNQMARAADLWVLKQSYKGEYVLSAAEVDGVGNVNLIEQII